MSERNAIVSNESNPTVSWPAHSLAPLRLTAIDGPVIGKSFAFDKAGAFLLGRSSRAQFQFPSGSEGDLRISHSHCLIEFDPPLCRVHDLKSHNGTHLNGKQITSSLLQDGDKLRIGQSVLRLDLAAPRDDETIESAQVSADLIPVPHIPLKREVVNRSACPICLKPKRRAEDSLCPKCRARAALMPQPVPGYRLVREVGRGGLGVTFLALSEGEHRAVALKTIDLTMMPKQNSLARFQREADLHKRLRHRYVTTCYDVGSVGRTIYLATELIRGTDAARLLKKHGTLSVRVALGIVCQLLSALKYAHALRVVHGDVKPSNLLIRIRPDRRTVKLADFGMARIYRNSRVNGPTLPGDLGGTTAFLAPEMVLDYRGSTPAADQYAAGATLYNLLTNAHVYDQPKRVSAQLAQILDEDIVPIRDRRAQLPPKLISIIHRALSRDPERRFPDAAAFKTALLPFGKL
jgi:serine/threonine-protein kinase